MKAVNKRIHYHLFPFGLWVFFKTKNSEIERILKEWIPVEAHEEIKHCFTSDIMDGRCYMFSTGQTVISFTDIDYGLLTHEALHATAFLLRRVGVPFSEDTEEVYAYTQAYIVEQIMEMFKK